jgi:tungstate transport system substrate-binding protein
MIRCTFPALAAIAALGLSATLGPAALAQDQFIIVQSTTSTEASGLFDHILPKFQEQTGIEARVVAVGTGQALKNAQNCDGDVLFVHARPDEEKFVEAGYGVERFDVMYNDFVIVGPASDPAKVGGMSDASEALATIAAAKSPFASRGDDSGTHKKELQLWAAAGGFKPWPGYLSAGQGAGRALMMAHELDAYDLVDRATLRQLARKHPLAILVEGDPRLLNEYGVTTLKPAPGRAVNEQDAAKFAAWIVSEPARRLVAGYRVDGEAVFKLR